MNAIYPVAALIVQVYAFFLAEVEVLSPRVDNITPTFDSICTQVYCSIHASQKKRKMQSVILARVFTEEKISRTYLHSKHFY
jgi:hypothetical protein